MRQIFATLVVFILLFSMLGCTAVATQTPLVTFEAVGETTDPIGTATPEKNPPSSTEAPKEKNKGLVVIDPYWHSDVNVFGGDKDVVKNRDLWNVTLGDGQYQWLKQTLEGSTAKYKFVFTHHVHGTGRGGIELANLFEWGGKDRKGADKFAQYRPGWDKPIHQLMADNHVTIFFQGHDHIFVRQEFDGVIYQTLPEPADPNYTLDNAEAYKSGDKLPNSGYVRVSVSPAGVTVEYIRSFLPQDEKEGQTDGQIAFSYTVQP